MIRIWFRDGEPPKCLAADTLPKLPGRVVDVEASSMPEALKIIRLASSDVSTPPETRDFKTLHDWYAWKGAVDAARILIREVPRA